ncbi:MAG: hypothetical protein HND44_11140 [Chloroflexi bacterium]|nr:hypothetical protein [Chloroflexota bacterium]GIK58221.1 MAG: hypothetical protein BroJett015_38840 [Chloroflexota bacterium]
MLDVTMLVPHTRKIAYEAMEQMVKQAIHQANQKSSREILAIPDKATEEEKHDIYLKTGRKLFAYFKRYCGDPASTAYQVHTKDYRVVGREQFRNWLVQKGRMNSGWRYQFLLFDCTRASGRFRSVSSIGTAEADFNAVIEFTDSQTDPLSLYVSVKNRRNTMGGQDWPKAIQALEVMANTDKNRVGPYCCVFAITMDKGQRHIKMEQRTKRPYSHNTEVWLSDFLWPFFANYTYEEIMTLVLDVLIEMQAQADLFSEIEVPETVLESFGAACREKGLIDEAGIFHDPHKLVCFFCG